MPRSKVKQIYHRLDGDDTKQQNKDMRTENITKRENTGAGLIAVGRVGFFVSMWGLGLFGAEVVFAELLPEILLPAAFLFIGVAGVGYMISGKHGVVDAVSIFGFIMFVAVVFRLIINSINTL